MADIFDQIDAAREAQRPALATCSSAECSNAAAEPIAVQVLDADTPVTCGVCGELCTIALVAA